MKYVIWGVCVVMIAWSARVLLTQSQKEIPTVGEVLRVEEKKPVTIALVGDVMMDRGVKRSVEKNMAGDYHALFANTTYLKDADITFANLEGTATDEISPRTGSRFSFRMDPKSLRALKDAGIDIVSFANNHVGDYSTKGFLGTIQNLKANTVLYTGAGKSYTEITTPKIIEVRGVKIGFLAATDVGPTWLATTTDKPGILLANNPHMSDIVQKAKEQVDILIVSFHWGDEYSPVNARQEKIARSVLDAGADIVVGHHPHVIEKVEEYNGKLIYYSLGNFIFDQYFSEHTMRGMVAMVSIDPETKRVTHSEFVSELSRQYVPQPLVPFLESMYITKPFRP